MNSCMESWQIYAAACVAREKGRHALKQRRRITAGHWFGKGAEASHIAWQRMPERFVEAREHLRCEYLVMRALHKAYTRTSTPVTHYN